MDAAGTDAVVLRVAREVLERSDLQLDDNFLDAGGDSLSALAMMLELQELYGCELPLESVFESGDLAELAATVAKLTAGSPG